VKRGKLCKNADDFRGELLLYQADDQSPHLTVRLQDETVWLSLNQMADLFHVDKSGISRHLKNIFDTGELEREGTVANFATVQKEGQREVARQVEFYNLDAIISVISVGYVEKHFIEAEQKSKKLETTHKNGEHKTASFGKNQRGGE
jgi:hypothetical protein